MRPRYARTPLDEVDGLLKRLADNKATALDNSDLDSVDAISRQIDLLLDQRFHLTTEAVT